MTVVCTVVASKELLFTI